MGVAGALIMPSTLSIIINVFPGARTAEGDRDLGERHRRGRRARPGRERLPARPLLVRLGLPRSTCRSSSSRSSPASSSCPKSRDPEESQFDPIGAVLSIVGIVALVYGLIEAPDKGWMSAGDARRVRGRGRRARAVRRLGAAHADEPMLDMHYFRRPAFSTGTGGMILVFLAMYGVMFLITQYFQLVLGYSPLVGRAAAHADRDDHARRRAVHAAAERAVRRAPHGRRSACSASRPASLLFTGLDVAHAVRVRRAVRRSRSPPASRSRCRR